MTAKLLLAAPILVALLALVRVIHARGDASDPRVAGMLVGLFTVAIAGLLVMTTLPACPAH